jgi:hypothetical protein
MVHAAAEEMRVNWRNDMWFRSVRISLTVSTPSAAAALSVSPVSGIDI